MKRMRAAVILWALSAVPTLTQSPSPRVVSPDIAADRRVTFRVAAPKAHAVVLTGEFMPGSKDFDKDAFLSAHQITHTFRETSGAHTWMVWRRYLHEISPLLFH